MRTIYPILIVVSLAVVFAMFAGAGVDDYFNRDSDGALVSERVEQQANSSSVNQGVNGSAGSSGNDNSVIGFLVSGSAGMGDVIGMVILLPWTLNDLGFPAWFAFPIGSAIELTAGIGLVQFVTGRVLR